MLLVQKLGKMESFINFIPVGMQYPGNAILRIKLRKIGSGVYSRDAIKFRVRNYKPRESNTVFTHLLRRPTDAITLNFGMQGYIADLITMPNCMSIGSGNSVF